MKTINQIIDYLDEQIFNLSVKIGDLILEGLSCIDPLTYYSIQDRIRFLERRKKLLCSIINYIKSDD